MEVTRHTLLSDKMGFHFFELRKLPDDVDDVSEKDDLLLWLALFRAETEEDLEKIKNMGVPTMDQAINAYYTITASPEFREIERLREKARHDEAQALYHAEQKGAIERSTEIARAMIADGEPVEKIRRYTGLATEAIERLRTENN